MGFSYDELEKYINGQCIEENVRKKIEKMICNSEHKRKFAKTFRK